MMSTMFLNDTQKGFTVGDRVIWSRHPELGVGKIEYIYKDYLVEMTFFSDGSRRDGFIWEVKSLYNK